VSDDFTPLPPALRFRETRNPERVSVDATQLRLDQAEPDQVLHYPIADGREDAPQILAYLKDFCTHYGRSPFIREFVRSILPASTRDNDQAVILRTVTSWVRDNIRYLPDPAGAEYFIDPIALITQVQKTGRAFGDCDDHVLLLNSMLNSVGFETRVEGVHLHDPVLWDHVISGVFVGGRWLDVDPCLKTNEMPGYREKLIA
jgi:transglutaminase-like putative cysteine protease